MINCSPVGRVGGADNRPCWLGTLAALLWLTGPALAADPVAEAYQRSYELEAAGKFRAALAALPAADAKSYIHQLRRGWLAHLAQDQKQSVAAYRQAIGLEPRAVEPWLGLMLPQMALRLWKDAEVSARKVLRMDSRNYLASSRLAWILFSLGRHGEAERMYAAVLEGYPGDVEMRSGLAWALVKQGKRDLALQELRAVLRVAPRNRAALDGLAAVGR